MHGCHEHCKAARLYPAADLAQQKRSCPPPPFVAWLPPLVMRREVVYLAAARTASGAGRQASGAWGGGAQWGPGLAAAAPSLFFSMLEAFRGAALPCEWLAHLAAQ